MLSESTCVEDSHGPEFSIFNGSVIISRSSTSDYLSEILIKSVSDTAFSPKLVLGLFQRLRNSTWLSVQAPSIGSIRIRAYFSSPISSFASFYMTSHSSTLAFLPRICYFGSFVRLCLFLRFGICFGLVH